MFSAFKIHSSNSKTIFSDISDNLID